MPPGDLGKSLLCPATVTERRIPKNASHFQTSFSWVKCEWSKSLDTCLNENAIIWHHLFSFTMVVSLSHIWYWSELKLDWLCPTCYLLSHSFNEIAITSCKHHSFPDGGGNSHRNRILQFPPELHRICWQYSLLRQSHIAVNTHSAQIPFWKIIAKFFSIFVLCTVDMGLSILLFYYLIFYHLKLSRNFMCKS